MRCTLVIIVLIAALAGCASRTNPGHTEVLIEGASGKATLRFDFGKFDRVDMEQALRECGVPADVSAHAKQKVRVARDNTEHENRMSMHLRLTRDEDGYSLKRIPLEEDTRAILSEVSGLDDFMVRAAREIEGYANGNLNMLRALR